MRLGRIMLIQLSIKCHIWYHWFGCAVAGDTFITWPHSTTWLARTTSPRE